MNLQQLRYVRETVRQGLSLTAAADALHTSQPGVSRQIRELESELGFAIFTRQGKRIAALTEPGKAVLAVIERLLQEADNLRRTADDFRDQDSGSLTLATTHTQARYALPRVLRAFKERYPKVHLTLKQGSPPQLAEMVLADAADIAIATESLDRYPGLLALPGYAWAHCAVVPRGHALLKAGRLTLEALARHPIVTYDIAFAGRSHIDEAFAKRGIAVDTVLSAMDADVIKTYVELGMGVGIIPSVAYNAQRDPELRALDCSHLFRSNTTRLAVKRGSLLRGYAFVFIELFAPALTRKLVQRALSDAAAGR